MTPKKRPLVQQFLAYTASGSSSFLFDLLLLWLLIDVLGIHYLPATIVAYSIAVSLNFVIARRFVFIGSRHSLKRSYAYFLTVASVGLLSVTSLMYLAVNFLSLPYIFSRIAVATMVGMVSFFLHKHISFLGS